MASVSSSVSILSEDLRSVFTLEAVFDSVMIPIIIINTFGIVVHKCTDRNGGNDNDGVGLSAILFELLNFALKQVVLFNNLAL